MSNEKYYMIQDHEERTQRLYNRLVNKHYSKNKFYDEEEESSSTIGATYNEKTNSFTFHPEKKADPIKYPEPKEDDGKGHFEPDTYKEPYNIKVVAKSLLKIAACGALTGITLTQIGKLKRYSFS